MRLSRVYPLFLALGAASWAAACDDPLKLPDASIANVVDTVKLYALHGTAIPLPSGYDMPSRTAVRTDAPGFDFAFDIDAAGTPVLYPAGALGLARIPGLRKMDASFDDVTSAPTTDYIDHEVFPLSVGMVFVGRSHNYQGDCGLTGPLPRYGKFRVLAVDATERSLSIEALVNTNCGYRELRPGIPTA